MSETINLNTIADRSKLAESIGVDIDDWSERYFTEGHRKHLGGSIIGRACSRELWYRFRWVTKEKLGVGSNRTAGQTLRLFQRGHREEVSITQYLTGIGCRFEATPDDQIRISDIGGHFGGSVDNVGYLPERYGIKDRFLFEFKTSNFKKFLEVKKHGVAQAQKVHFSQMCVYGVKLGIRYGFYLVVDKNSDELYIEIVKLDRNHGMAMIDKAGAIISSPTPLDKYSNSPANYVCKWCFAKDVCHNGATFEKNCRSCSNSRPADGKKWTCDLAGGAEIPEEVITVGCDSYNPIANE